MDIVAWSPHLFEILGAPTVFEVMDNRGKHRVRVADPDECDLLEVGQVGQVRDVEHGLPAGQRADVGEDMDEVVHAGVGDLPAVEGDEGELVHPQGGDDTEGAEEGVADAVLAQGGEGGDLPAQLLEPHVSDGGVRDVHVTEGEADGVEYLECRV